MRIVRADRADDPVQSDHFREARAAQSRVLLEDYVELIAELQQQPGMSVLQGGDEASGLPGPAAQARLAASVGPTRIARHLGVSHATAIKCIGRLCREGLAETQPYRGVNLTDAGQALAATVRRRHRIVLELLVRLGVPAEAAQADAEGIEHHVSSATLDAFERFLAVPEPSGDSTARSDTIVGSGTAARESSP